MQVYAGRTFVVKYGGHAMGDPSLAAQFAQDIVLLKRIGINPIVVHGGGPQIGEMLERLKIKSDFVDGLRVTDQATVEIVEMVLSGSINKQIVTAINRVGGVAVGLSGKDGDLVRARKLRQKVDRQFGFQHREGARSGLRRRARGDQCRSSAETLERSSIIPVVAPIGVGEDGTTYNINGDTVAGAIAAAMGAARLFMLTDIEGVLDREGRLIGEMTAREAREVHSTMRRSPAA